MLDREKLFLLLFLLWILILFFVSQVLFLTCLFLSSAGVDIWKKTQIIIRTPRVNVNGGSFLKKTLSHPPTKLIKLCLRQLAHLAMRCSSKISNICQKEGVRKNGIIATNINEKTLFFPLLNEFIFSWLFLQKQHRKTRYLFIFLESHVRFERYWYCMRCIMHKPKCNKDGRNKLP